MLNIINLSGLIYAIGKDAWSSYANEKQYKQEKLVVNINYPSETGIKDAWERKGYRLVWVAPRDVASRQLAGYEIIYNVNEQKKEIVSLECWNENGKNNLIYMGKKEMKLFKLTPIASKINDSQWSLSTHKEELIIRAATEEDARLLAAKATAIMGKNNENSPICPWNKKSELTDCILFTGTEYPIEGKEQVLKPSALNSEILN